jgi:hypothetical protein
MTDHLLHTQMYHMQARCVASAKINSSGKRLLLNSIQTHSTATVQCSTRSSFDMLSVT